MGQHVSVQVGKVVNNPEGVVLVVARQDAAVVELIGDERHVEVAVPLLQQRGRDVGVGALWVYPLVAFELQTVDLVNVTGYPDRSKVKRNLLIISRTICSLIWLIQSISSMGVPT